MRKLYSQDPERFRARAQAWRAANRERVRATKRAYYWANKEKMSEQKKASRLRNKDKTKERYLLRAETDREDRSEYSRLWRLKNLDRVTVANKEIHYRRRLALEIVKKLGINLDEATE